MRSAVRRSQSKGLGVRHPHPAEDPAQAPARLAAAGRPSRRCRRAAGRPRPRPSGTVGKSPSPSPSAVDTAAQSEPVEQLADQHQTPPFVRFRALAADSHRLSAALPVRPASRMMISLRLGALRFGSARRESSGNLRPQAVQTYPCTTGSGLSGGDFRSLLSGTRRERGGREQEGHSNLGAKDVDRSLIQSTSSDFAGATRNYCGNWSRS